MIWDRPELLELRDAGAVAYDAPERHAHRGRLALSAGAGREVSLQVPGVHNAVNAAGSARGGASRRRRRGDGRSRGLAGFQGAGRRFQLVGASPGGARVYDDYAHHPTEIAATLTAARTLGPRRLIAAFQPHLYSRTALLAREFGAALALADEVVVLDVYPARERAEDHPGVSGLTIAESAADAAGGRTVFWLPTFAQAARVLRPRLGEGDVCMVMGAGDVQQLSRMLVAP